MSRRREKKLKPAVSGGATAPSAKRPIIAKLRARPWFLLAVSTAVTLSAIYSVALFSPTFISSEDSVLRLPVLAHAGNIPHILSRDFLLFSSGQFRPLGYVLLAFARTFVSADSVFFWHIWLLTFHMANALLVFAIVRHFTPKLSVGLTAAAVFALHPLCTVIVNDINQFHILFGLTLSLCCLKSYLSFSRTRKKYYYAAAVVLFFLGCVTARLSHPLGVILLGYELAYRRSGLKHSLLRMLPFAVIPLLLLPFWLWRTPHPLHYKYVAVFKGSFWHGLFSVTGATRQYAGGLLLTRGIPIVLHETVRQIYRWSDSQFLLWAGMNAALVVGATVALVKKQWAAVGILLVYVAMIPYASVAYNRVPQYVSWSYLYLPVAGLALFLAGMHELAQRSRLRHLRTGIQTALLGFILFLGWRTVQLNARGRSPLTYWNYVSALNEESQTALYETGKAYLAEGRLPLALHYFFAPMVKEVKYPCLAMARYYCRQGNPLASAIHLRLGSVEQKTGMILEDQCEVAAELLLSGGALDHAEENYGKILMVNPFHVDAMLGLAQTWFLKGFVAEAHRMLERALALAPKDPRVSQLREAFREQESIQRTDMQPLRIRPPEPDFLRYILTQVRTPSLRREIVALSDVADPNDAVIQLEALICLLEDKNYEAAVKDPVPPTGKTRAEMVLFGLSGNAYACAVVCRGFALAGEVERAVGLGMHAVSLDRTNNLAWSSLALAMGMQDKPDAAIQKFSQSLAQNPATAATFYYNLGLQKKQLGKDAEAVSALQEAIKAQPAHVEALQALGDVFLRLERFDEAIRILQKAVALNPASAETQANLGQAFLRQGKNAEALVSLAKAIELNPQSALFHSDMGVALERLNKQQEAAEEYRRAISLNPNLVNAHHNLGNLCVKMGNIPEAVREYREAIRIMPAHKSAHLSLGWVLYRQGETDEAIREIEEGLRHNPTFAPGYEMLIKIYCDKGALKEAWEVVKRAKALGIQVDPDTMATLKRLSP
ncbi:MAG: tetratricopeptide repeat protein [bacterium]|nr:tetratricopeptide repeat protein [bacterium]